jgi:hypothetical protein
VARVEDWPGISLVKSMLNGEPIRGSWFDRTEEHKARLRGEDFEHLRYATEETVVLSQLPCWRHLSPEVYRELIAGLVKEIDSDAAAERKLTGRQRSRRSAHPAPASAHLSEQDEEIAGATFPCGKQGSPRGVAEGLRPLPGGVPGSGREAQGRGSAGEIPPRLLSAGSPVHGCVSGRVAAAGDRRRRASHIKDARWITPERERSVRTSKKSSIRPGGNPCSGPFCTAE